MTYHTMAAAAVSSFGAVYFVGPGAVFSRVALRTVETELDGPTHRVPDMDALRFARMTETGTINPAYMVVAHESCAPALLDALERRAEFLPKRRLAIAFENEANACAMFADNRDELLQWRVSLLPMNTNVTNWVRLLQVIQAGGQYVPPELLQTRAPHPAAGEPSNGAADGSADASTDGSTDGATDRAKDGATDAAKGRVAGGRPRTGRAARNTGITGITGARAQAHAGSEIRAQDGLTPREAEVLAMAAAGSPNKLIAGELELSEHTVKLYMHRIIGKLGVRNRTEAAVWYHQKGQHG